MKVTLKEVASRAGVHTGTASRALNEKTRGLVKEATAERIEAAALELGYRPNLIARSLKTRRSYTVGVLIPNLANPYFPTMVRGIQDSLGQAGYIPLIVNTEDDPIREHMDVMALRGRGVDGYISATARTVDDAATQVIAEGLPLVLVNRAMPGKGVSSVVSDDRLGMMLAVRHLAGLGHCRIAFLGGPLDTATGRGRLDGFHDAMISLGLEVTEELSLSGVGFTLEEGSRMVAKLLATGRPFTAVVAGNDLLALGCLDALAERGLTCPEQMSVTGYNDMPFAERFMPPLTTVRVPQYEIGTLAGALLIDCLEHPDKASDQIRLEPTLVVRGSTAVPSSQQTIIRC